MALTIIGANSVGTGNRVTSNTDDADFLLLENAIVWSTDFSDGFVLTASNHDLELRGAVIGRFGVQLGNDPAADSGNRLHVTATGSISGGSEAVVVYGSASLLNEGEIRSASLVAVLVNLSGSSTATITNRGVISAEAGTIAVSGISGTTATIMNQGTIHGSLSGSNGLDLVTNRGLWVGDIFLRDGNDLFDNRVGLVTGGAIFGGFGDDLFRPGRGAETISGDAGFDTLDFRSSSAGLTASLAGGAGTGDAAGDSYAGIEQVLGSRFGDRLIGDGLANTLRGGGGADRLRGGFGDDAFLFLRPAEGGDRLLDFHGEPGNAGDDDRFEIDASGFGGGLQAGGFLAPGQFRTRANSNAAQDGNDRFVFRRSDETLWFDRDGDGSRAPVLLADLQNGATVTSGDIFLV